MNHDAAIFIFGANINLVSTLADFGVRFLVVGGLAVKLYAPSRMADDLDLLLEQTFENARRLFMALAKLDIYPEFPQELIAVPGDRPQQMSLKAIHYADLLTHPGIDFSFEYSQAIEAQIGHTIVRFASRALLMRLKGSSDREKDIADVALLSGHT